ncbi:MAG TPA: FecR domain-containing protein [Rhizomicrobium sp.]|nr:FecR domain-containing protein [Rhizomicrobium sp.]
MTILDAKAINLEAAGWIERQDRAGWTDIDQGDLDAWLAQSTAHLIAYHRMRDTWKRSEKLVVLRAQFANARPRPVRHGAPTAMRVLVATIMFAVLGAVVYFSQPPSGRVYATAVGERQTLRLSDGSRIELNTNTMVRIAKSGRAVTLERGEAFFHIVHNEMRPFIVTVGEHRVVDLGTTFDVRREDGRLEVALIEGKARVDALGKGRARTTMLAPGDVMVATANSVVLTRHTNAKLTDQLGWRRDVIVFSHTALADAAAELNRYNGRKIVITDPVVAKMKIGGTFPVNGTAQLIDVARDLFKLRVQDGGDEVIISR